jgi:uncharacterized protein YneF (UPF0154 family)
MQRIIGLLILCASILIGYVGKIFLAKREGSLFSIRHFSRLGHI